jgi:solute carrier family 25 phosphate transporter 23/24/25/41
MGNSPSKTKDAGTKETPTPAAKLNSQSQKSVAIFDTFDALDADNSGTLDFGEVQAGLQKLGYPANYAYDVFVQLDHDKDHQISFVEFKTWVEAKYDDMRKLFDSVDRDNSGHIDLKELKLMLYHLDMPVTNAQDLMNKLDKDGDQQISFQEFQDGFALLSPVHFSALKDTWMEYESDSDLAGVSAIDVSHTGKREESKTVPAWTSAVAGALGNSFSRTVIAPLERTRVQMIADPGRYPSMMACMTDIMKNEGIKGFWAGNTLNVGRIAPQMAIAFFAKDYFKTLYAGGEGKQPTALQTLAASMSSGIVCQTGVYPIDLVRTRIMTSPGTYTGIMDCLTQSIKTEGVFALYKGLLPANMFAVPYYGTQFFVYDMMKVQYSTFGKKEGEPPRPANPLIGIPLGAISSMTACFVAFPFQMAWKRLQVQGIGGRPVLYSGTFDCIKTVVAKEGVKGVYAGLIPNLIKLAPTGAISFMAVEAIKDYMGWRPGKM